MEPSSSYEPKVVAKADRPKESAMKKATTTKPARRIFAPTLFRKFTIWGISIPSEYQSEMEDPGKATEATLLLRITSRLLAPNQKRAGLELRGFRLVSVFSTCTICASRQSFSLDLSPAQDGFLTTAL